MGGVLLAAGAKRGRTWKRRIAKWMLLEAMLKIRFTAPFKGSRQ